jgi:RES domain-containing protein
MILWRLADPRYARDLAGTGNRMFGARWNSPGRGVVYCAEHLSLAVLESLVHLPAELRASLPPRHAIRIEIPDEARAAGITQLPRGLRNRRLAEWCRRSGDQWLDEGSRLLLRAPSIIVPQEYNVMLNPAHPLMLRVRITQSKPFTMDARLAAPTG